VPAIVVLTVPPRPSKDREGGFCNIWPLTVRVPFTVKVMDDEMVPNVIEAHDTLVVTKGGLVYDTTPICTSSVEVGITAGLQLDARAHALLVPPFQAYVAAVHLMLISSCAQVKINAKPMISLCLISILIHTIFYILKSYNWFFACF
jgi:hypothetical protein